MKNCEKSADVVKNGSTSYGMAKFHLKILIALCTNLASVFNYSMVVGLKNTMTDRTKNAIFIVQTEIP